MKKAFLVLMALVFSSVVSFAAPSLGSEYKLSKVIEVEGRQGIAADDKYYYISSSTELFKYDKEGNLVKKMTLLLQNLKKKQITLVILMYGMEKFILE